MATAGEKPESRRERVERVFKEWRHHRLPSGANDALVEDLRRLLLDTEAKLREVTTALERAHGAMMAHDYQEGHDRFKAEREHAMRVLTDGQLSDAKLVDDGEP